MEWARPVIELATAAGFGGLVWYLIAKHLPAVEARHRTERAEWRESSANERNKWLEAIEGLRTDYNHTLRALIDERKGTRPDK